MTHGPHMGVGEGFSPPSVTDHAAAAVELLARIIALLNAGTSPEDLGRQVTLIGRMMERRT